MADTAIVVKVIRDVTGVGHALEIGLVAGVTIRRRAGIRGRVTRDTGGSFVRAGEWEYRSVVIKVRRKPRVGRVATQTVMIKVGGDMVRIGDTLKVSLVTRPAVIRPTGIRRVTIFTQRVLVSPGQRELSQIVIILRGFEVRGRVANHAIVIISQNFVIGFPVFRLLVICFMTRVAVSSESIIGSRMTRTAFDTSMCPLKLKRLVGIRSVLPRTGRRMVTAFAVRRKPGAVVTWIFGGGKRLTVAADAVHGCSGVLFTSMVPVTGLAIGYGMQAGQREPFLSVHLEHILAALPVAFDMAIFARLAELTLMLIGVTVNTRRPHMIELGRFMTANTLCRAMSAGQMEAGLIMIKLHLVTEFQP